MHHRHKKKALSLIQAHFTFSADEITKAYQNASAYTFIAISVGLDTPEQKFSQTVRYSNVTREFAKMSCSKKPKLYELMAQRGISSQVSPRDELTQYDSESLQLIQSAVDLLKPLPTQHPAYSQVSLKVGSALFCDGVRRWRDRWRGVVRKIWPVGLRLTGQCH
ncbi:MAG: hypothetical protein ABFS56_13265 [Pseudomonadota bacterium]